MSDLEPITRNEKLWSGEDLTPVTRREMYIKHLYDETQVIPDHPVTREEMFILKAGEELHDVTIEQLTATENRTYSPPSGTDGYDEVTVDVPLPSNAYLLKEIEDVEIASFNDGSDLSMPKLEVAIEPVQEGSGDPSPENIRPILGWDECNVTRTGKNLYGGIDFANSVKDASPIGEIDTTNKTVAYSYGTGSKTTIFDTFKPLTSYTFLFKVADCAGQNFSMRIAYTDGTTEGIEILPSDIGNYVRKVSDPNKSVSKLAVFWYQTTLVKLYYDECGIFEGNIQVTDFEPYNGQTYTLDLDGTRYGGKVDLVSGVMTVTHGYADLNNTNNWQLYNGGNYDMYYLDGVVNDISISEESLAHVICSKYPYSNDAFVKDAFRINTGKRLYIGDTRFANDLSGFKESLTNGVQLVYELATPITIQLPPTVVKSLRGMNNVYADSGNILDLSYLAKEE